MSPASDRERALPVPAQPRARGLPGLIGVIHLPALAGAPGASELLPSAALQRAGMLAVQEARQLAQAGFEGVILENFGDLPFYRDRVPPETVASMAVIATAVREAVRVPIGINILRNDAHAALAVAAVAGCQFIRVNVLSGVAATDQGIVEGDAARLIRERHRLGAEVALLADAHVKHARTLSSDSLELAVEDVALRAMADGVILTGATTGRAVELTRLDPVAELAAAHGIPLFVGSGARPEDLAELRRRFGGVIVGSALRQNGRAGAPLDGRRLKEFVRAYAAAGTRSGSRTSKRQGARKKNEPRVAAKAAKKKRARRR